MKVRAPYTVSIVIRVRHRVSVIFHTAHECCALQLNADRPFLLTSQCTMTASSICHVALLVSMITIVCGIHDDGFDGREVIAGLCRVYSYNVERQAAAAAASSSWVVRGGSHDDEQQVSSSKDRRYFVCCQNEGRETACRDRTYQRPYGGGQAEEG